MQAKQTKKTAAIVLLVLFGCGVMGFVDGWLQPGYGVKSAVKVVTFLLIPAIYALFDPTLQLKKLFAPSKKGLGVAFLLAVGVYAIILGGYFIFRNLFDFSNITSALTKSAGISKENFVWVALYISFVNSLLEEFFFRGFAFLLLNKAAGPAFAHTFSVLAFAVYHTAILTGWFSVWAYLLIMAGLVVGGLIFNLLNSKTQTIYTSWLVHMFANFAINTVGFLLFDLL